MLATETPMIRPLTDLLGHHKSLAVETGRDTLTHALAFSKQSTIMTKYMV